LELYVAVRKLDPYEMDNVVAKVPDRLIVGIDVGP